MSESVTGQTSAKASSMPDDSVSEPHANGHLVSTGWKHRNIAENHLFIHTEALYTGENCCQVFTYNANRQNISDLSGFSPRITIKEHGWFTDVVMFQQIARNHPIPNGQSPEDIFINWRDSLLAFLDTTYGGIHGQWTPIT
jgi:hypothetical protein